ncbi:hypothetical protein [uncultured Rikenella sp.]|uniref:hypothetical protein n=1 Tax=uncultured Rikenella sp. TaxID=368003 RepID=UPI0025F26CEA|nr:hypothetical protein [uncultured Rikenella sp.]
MSASLRLRFRSAASSRAGKSCPNADAHFDDFPLQAWRAIWALPRLELFFLTLLRSFSFSPFGNLQTAFALHSPAASVVSKKNKKTFDGCLRILKLSTAQSSFARPNLKFALSTN